MISKHSFISKFVFPPVPFNTHLPCALYRLQWILLTVTIWHLTYGTRTASTGAETPLSIPSVYFNKTWHYFQCDNVYLLTEWYRCLLWLSNFLCIRSLARQQWKCAVNGEQILKEERRGEIEAAIFVRVDVAHVYVRAQKGMGNIGSIWNMFYIQYVLIFSKRRLDVQPSNKHLRRKVYKK